MKAAEFTKEDYLRLRSQGNSKATIAMMLKTSTNRIYEKLGEWGISTAEDERRAIMVFDKNGGFVGTTRQVERPVQTNTAKFSLDAVNWFLPEESMSRITLTNRGVRIAGKISERFTLGESVRIGVISGQIVVQACEDGWKLKPDSANYKKSSVKALVAGSKNLVEKIEKLPGMTHGKSYPAKWLETEKIIVAGEGV